MGFQLKQKKNTNTAGMSIQNVKINLQRIAKRESIPPMAKNHMPRLTHGT
jgi:hypothetical protein